MPKAIGFASKTSKFATFVIIQARKLACKGFRAKCFTREAQKYIFFAEARQGFKVFVVKQKVCFLLYNTKT